MGMDVNGLKPTTKEGEYFSNNVWRWRPLAAYITEFAPVESAPCTHWQYNDGDGLNAEQSIALADKLQHLVDSGHTKKYEEQYDAEIAAMADEKCDLCDGTGIRSDLIGVQGGMTERVINEVGHPRNGETGWCNKCNGTGWVRPFATAYPFTVDNVREFITFLRGCGGFEIN